MNVVKVHFYLPINSLLYFRGEFAVGQMLSDLDSSVELVAAC